jgi:hypothetical protein
VIGYGRARIASAGASRLSSSRPRLCLRLIGEPRRSPSPAPHHHGMRGRTGRFRSDREARSTDLHSRLGQWPAAAKPSPGAGLSSSSRSFLLLVLPVQSFALGLGRRSQATLTSADCCPAISAACVRAQSISVVRHFPGYQAALSGEARELSLHTRGIYPIPSSQDFTVPCQLVPEK